MKKNKYPGLLIAMEGLDGSGLSTQTKRVVEVFRKNDTGVYLTKEPTNNVIGGLVRGVLSGVYELEPEAVQLLFSADRSHHLSREIIPMLKGGNTVVCDRYVWSTIAFGSLNWIDVGFWKLISTQFFLIFRSSCEFHQELALEGLQTIGLI
jgi:dTMP kinase